MSPFPVLLGALLGAVFGALLEAATAADSPKPELLVDSMWPCVVLASKPC